MYQKNDFTAAKQRFEFTERREKLEKKNYFSHLRTKSLAPIEINR